MGLLIDTSVFIAWERKRRRQDFAQWSAFGEAKISVVTASELLVGVHRADTPERQSMREAFVEGILTRLPIVEIHLGIARLHAQLLADLATQGATIGAHDLWLAATAVYLSDAVLTTNVKEFSRIAGLQVIDAA